MNIQYVNKHLLVPNGRPRHFELRRGQSFGLDSYYIRCKQSVIKPKKNHTINQIITRWFLAITGRRWEGTGDCNVDNSEVSDANTAEHRDLPEPANARV